MSCGSYKSLPLAVTGISSTLGEVIPIEAFAAALGFPDRYAPGTSLRGDFLRSRLGLESKSWDRALFSQSSTLVNTARDAMASAGLSLSDIDCFLAVSCTPLYLNLDQDLFLLNRALGFSDRVSAWQIHAGCAAIPRVLHLLADLPFNNTLLLFYNLASPAMTDAAGALNPLYGPHSSHPRAERLWFSAALFADGAAAAVLSRTEKPGLVYYTRDTESVDGTPPFSDPLIHFTGGGAVLPPGRPGSEHHQVFEIATDQTSVYYPRAMANNDEALRSYRPSFRSEIRRYYIHQASAPAARALYEQLEMPLSLRHVHADRYGNLSSPAIWVMLHEDLADGTLHPDDRIALSAVGAGPERGACLLPLRVARVLPIAGNRYPLRRSA